jgi:hypothetical protein
LVLDFHGGGLSSPLECALLEIEDLLIISLLVLNSYLLKWQFLLFREVLPSIAYSLHYLHNCQVREPLPDDFPEFLTEVNVGREGLLRLSLRGLILKGHSDFMASLLAVAFGTNLEPLVTKDLLLTVLREDLSLLEDGTLTASIVGGSQLEGLISEYLRVGFCSMR